MTDTTGTGSTGVAAPTLPPLSGTQSTLTHGAYSATIASIGASLRTLTWQDRDLVVPFRADEVRPLYRGAILAPWPNRVVDGTYLEDGVERQLPLTEPTRGHALHGLVAWSDWRVERTRDDQVTLTTTVVPSDGYPHRLDLFVTYRLDHDGLTTTATVRNVGSSVAPYGTGPHPYLSAGTGKVDDWILKLPASAYLDVTADRLIPVGLADVDTRPEFDFREPRTIGDTFIDHAFTGIARKDDVATVTLTAPGGEGVQMTWGPELSWLQVHTGDRPEPEWNRAGLAVEPMTCPPDAFSSGQDLVRLSPGASHSASWRIAAIAG